VSKLECEDIVKPVYLPYLCYNPPSEACNGDGAFKKQRKIMNRAEVIASPMYPGNKKVSLTYLVSLSKYTKAK
jgi:hypothetical protein